MFQTMYQTSKYNYKTLCVINNDVLVGGSKFKVIQDKPKLKYIRYNGGKTIHVLNTVDEEEINEHSEFMIGSITEVFTGVLIFMLNAKGLLDINLSINNYIKSNDLNDFTKTTVGDLINHRGGIVWYLTHRDIDYKKVKTSNDALKIFMQKPLVTNEIGECRYSFMGFIILGAIIERVTGLSYVDALKKYIFEPCKMHNTNLGEPNVTMYNLDKPLKELDQQQMEKYMVNAGGGLYSSVSDMIKFAKKLPEILTPEQIKKIYEYEEKNTISHDGFICGGSAKFKVEYTNEWKIKNIVIEFNTYTDFDY